jgi:hypothetical protein
MSSGTWLPVDLYGIGMWLRCVGTEKELRQQSQQRRLCWRGVCEEKGAVCCVELERTGGRWKCDLAVVVLIFGGRSSAALYAFQPLGKYQVSLTPGDELRILEQADGWYKGTCFRCG